MSTRSVLFPTSTMITSLPRSVRTSSTQRAVFRKEERSAATQHGAAQRLIVGALLNPAAVQWIAAQWALRAGRGRARLQVLRAVPPPCVPTDGPLRCTRLEVRGVEDSRRGDVCAGVQAGRGAY